MAGLEDTGRVRTKQCVRCCTPFQYRVARGADRTYCGDECVRLARTERKRFSPTPMCSIGGCGNDANRVRAGLCEMHYMRQRRNGTFDRLVPKRLYKHTHGYVMVRCEGHPLVKGRRSPIEYEHRVVYFNAHGCGPFSCHHCGKQVTWSDMHVDHLNDMRSDNRIDNLVASCALCNQKRGRSKMIATARAAGNQITAFGRSMTAGEWAAELNISRVSLVARLKNGWPVERAVSESRGLFGPKAKRATG